MIADTYPLEVSRRLERLMRFAFGNVFNRTFQPTFSRVAAAGITTLILDEFTDANGTALTSHTIAPTNVPATSWSQVNIFGTPSIQIQSNLATLIYVTDSNSFAIANLNAGVANVVITATVTTAAIGRNEPQGVIGRYNTSSSFWTFGVSTNLDKIQIMEQTATERASAAKTIANSASYNLTITMNGDVLTLDVDGTSCTYTSSTNNTKTVHGAYFYARNTGSYAGTKIDNFQVTTV